MGPKTITAYSKSNSAYYGDCRKWVRSIQSIDFSRHNPSRRKEKMHYKREEHIEMNAPLRDLSGKTIGFEIGTQISDFSPGLHLRYVCG